MRIGILGSGLMGGKLGTIFARAGHDVVFSYARTEQSSTGSHRGQWQRADWYAYFVLSRRILDHLRVGRDRVKGRQDRQHGNFGADPLGQGDAVLDSFPGEFRPICGYQDIGIHRLSLITTF
jgi:hypothetical protein